jgi:hypothetical protein
MGGACSTHATDEKFMEEGRITVPGCTSLSFMFLQQLIADLEHCIHLLRPSDDTKVSPRTCTVLGFVCKYGSTVISSGNWKNWETQCHLANNILH